MGSGKTTTLGECSDLLRAARIAHAAVDLDALGIAYCSARDVTLQNLASVCNNFASAGIRQLLIAAAVESRSGLDGIVEATQAARAFTCRLRATITTMEARVAAREAGGTASEQYVRRVRELERLLDAAGIEDLMISTEATSVSEVARTVLQRSGWL